MVIVLSGWDTGGSASVKPPSWDSWKGEHWDMLPGAAPEMKY